MIESQSRDGANAEFFKRASRSAAIEISRAFVDPSRRRDRSVAAAGSQVRGRRSRWWRCGVVQAGREIPAEGLWSEGKRAVGQRLHGEVVGADFSGSVYATAALSSSERMRWRISAAAALVKVMATIWPGVFNLREQAKEAAGEEIGLARTGGRLDENGVGRIECAMRWA